MATSAAVDFGVSSATRSPGRQPASLRRRASFVDRASSSAYVRRLPSHTTAVASGRRCACSVTQCCRSLCIRVLNHDEEATGRNATVPRSGECGLVCQINEACFRSQPMDDQCDGPRGGQCDHRQDQDRERRVERSKDSYDDLNNSELNDVAKQRISSQQNDLPVDVGLGGQRSRPGSKAPGARSRHPSAEWRTARR